VRLTRRAFLRTAAAGVATAAGAGAYMRWAEPHWLEVHRVHVPTGRGGLRILHLSDFHASPVVSVAFIAEAIALGLAEKPDLIALTGDFITDRMPAAAADYATALARLSAAAPTFACLGNHDGGTWTRRAGGLATPDETLALLRRARITCLVNESQALTIKGRAVQLFGVGDLWSDQCDAPRAFASAPARAEALRVVLNHNPDAKDRLRPHDWDLMLSGHTHGGQLRLPLLGAPFAPVADHRFLEGLHRWENRWLHVTRGVGNLHGLRFNCRPQVSVLDIG